MFGYPGGAVLPLYDEIFKQDKVKHILVRHEQAAVHAADAYARSTEKVGVVLVTSGPGRDQRGDRNRDGLHGFHPGGHHQRTGADSCHRPGRIPGSGRRRRDAPLRQTQFPGQGRQGPRGHDEEGVLSRRPPAGPVRCWWISRRTCRPRRRTSSIRNRCRCAHTTRWSRGTAARSRRRCNCCWKPSARWFTPAAASCSATRRRNSAIGRIRWAFPVPIR